MTDLQHYKQQKRLEILRSQCFNNASHIIAAARPVEYIKNNPDEIFELAHILFDAAIKAKMEDWGEQK